METGTRAALKKFFGFDSFLDNQEDVVAEILAGKDVCVVMPTGAGKSLCYQLPLLMRDSYGIIVSPLISLMKDQVDALRRKNIPAACINTTVPFPEQREILHDAARGIIKLLYVAPERFQAGFFRSFLRENQPSALIVDEAHCISQWGHDFRPSYLRLGETLEEFSIPQVCAFTATATKKVREDILTELRRPQMHLHVAGFKRPNLAFSVLSLSGAEEKNRKIAELLKDKVPTIIYTSTRKAVEQLQEEFSCIGYHAGMSDELRTQAQERFMSEPAPVLAATNAFGMGIDRPDVRRVIHYNIPGSIEAYYQEAGRAGRDGEPAECILFSSYSDRFVQEFLIDMNNPPEEAVRSVWRVLRARASKDPEHVLEVTNAELREYVPEAKSEGQIGAALSILEQHGFLERSYRSAGTLELNLLGNPQEIEREHAAEATQRSRFLHRYLNAKGRLAMMPEKTTLAELSAIAGLGTDQIRRVLRALNGSALEYKADHHGRALEILRMDDPEPQIDFSAYDRKRDLELSRLDDMLSYTSAARCRQAFLIRYFGEDAEDWTCGTCDHCAGIRSDDRELTEHECQSVEIILLAVRAFHGRLGRGRLSQILAGARSAELVRTGYFDDPCFGLLRSLKQNVIMKYLKVLEDAGFLERVGNPEYPCLALSGRGRDYLKYKGPLRLPLPETAAPSPKKTKRLPDSVSRKETAPEGSDDLFQTLRALRRTLAEEKGVPPYAVLTDKALHALAEVRPRTQSEARDLPGIGPVKLHTVVPLFLEEIRKFRG